MKSCSKGQYGFSLLESLVAMVILAVGMLAVAGFQTVLSRNADVAKQRTEATRLAQEKMEQLRSFDSLTAYGTVMVSSTTGSGGTQETITTNAAYTRSWAVTSAAAVDSGRTLIVTVAWTDRTGEAQQVQIFSNISATDPKEVGGLWYTLPDGTILRRPKNRSIDIPIPAVSISGTGKSAIQWTGSSGGYLVFSDASGDIIRRCASLPTADTVDICSTFDGYLLTGYIGGAAVAKATGVSFSSTQYMSNTPECIVDAAKDQNSPTTTLTGFKYYACLITPTDHDSSALTARVWTGRADLTGSFSSGDKSCRYTKGTSANDDHPETYSLVDRSLDNQNFFVTNSNCVTGSALLKTY